MSAIVTKLKGIVGDQNVIDNPTDMAKYLKGNGKPVAVVFPKNTCEVSSVVKCANETNTKISVAGLVADTEGLDDGIVLIMSRMNQLVELDELNLVATVEAGMTHKEFLEVLNSKGLYFPPEPYAVDTSSVGGCFAIGDSDSKSFSYGPTRMFLLGFEMVLPTGEVMDIGNKCIKNVSGLDFIHLAVGSLGTFGIFTKLLVKLMPMPNVKKTVVARFDCMKHANSTFNTFIKRNIHPQRMNLISKSLVKDVIPGEGHLAIVSLEGFANSGSNLANEIASVFTLAGGKDVQILEDAKAIDEVTNGWLQVRQTLNNQPAEVIEFAVGPMKMPQALLQLEGIIGTNLGSYPGIVVEGLLGFVRVLLPENVDKMELASKVNKMAMSLGGNVTGYLGHKLMCEVYNDAEMWSATSGLVNELRKQFDPKGIMNPWVSL